MEKLKEIGIRNFRGIKEGRIVDLSTLNIFVGRNNSGKSTVLDAIQLLSKVTKQKDSLGRDVFVHMQQRRAIRNGTLEHAMHYNYKIDEPVKFELLFDGNSRLNLSCDQSHKWKIESNFTGDFTIMSFNNATSFDAIRKPNGPNIGAKGSWQDFLTHWIDVSQGMKDSIYKLGRLVNYISDSILIDATLVRNFKMIEEVLWHKLVSSRKVKELTNIINKSYSLEIEHFTSSRPEWMTENVLMAEFSEKTVRLDDMGDGIRYSFTVLSLALQDDVKILLLEEPETAQHPTALHNMAKVLVDLATRKDQEKQIFVATHSLDLINAFVDAMQEKVGDKIREELKIYLLSLQNDILDAKNVDAYDARMLKELGIDLRRFVELYTYLIVEGSEDRTFLEAVSRKLNGRTLLDLKYETYVSPKDEQNKVIKALGTSGRKIKVIEAWA